MIKGKINLHKQIMAGVICSLLSGITLAMSAGSDVISCQKGLGRYDQNGQYQVDPTFKDYQLFVSVEGVLLRIGPDLKVSLYPVSNNPQISKDNKRFYLFYSNPPFFDTAIWEVRYFIDDQIAIAYSTDRKKINPFRVGIALCPSN